MRSCEKPRNDTHKFWLVKSIAAISPFREIEPLSGRHRKLRAAFSSGEEALDRYLKEQASQDAESRACLPFVLVSHDDRIAGYYTLSSYGILLGDIPPELIKQLRLRRYDIVSATLLGRLARDLSFKGRGLGEFLLMDALKRALYGSHNIASSVGVIADAKNEKAVKFYSDFGFIAPFPDSPRRLFLPMETIEQLFAATQRALS